MPWEGRVAANTVTVAGSVIANTGANTMAGDDRGYINLVVWLKIRLQICKMGGGGQQLTEVGLCTHTSP